MVVIQLASGGEIEEIKIGREMEAGLDPQRWIESEQRQLASFCHGADDAAEIDREIMHAAIALESDEEPGALLPPFPQSHAADRGDLGVLADERPDQLGVTFRFFLHAHPEAQRGGDIGFGEVDVGGG